MVEPQAGDLAFPDQPQDQLVRGGEDVGFFHAHTGQVLNVKETAIVDLIESSPPISEPVGLLFQKFMEAIEAIGPPGLSVACG